MSAGDVFLGSLLLAGLALPLLVLPWWIFFFRTRLAAPRCARCLHRLGESGVPTVAACPECGLFLASNGVRYGRLSPRWWWALGFPIATLGSLLGLATLSTMQVAGTAPATPVATVEEMIERVHALRSTRTKDDVWALHSAVGIGLIRSLPPEWLASRRGDLADAFSPGVNHQSQIQLAAGMMSEQLGVSIVEALVRLRARAYAQEHSLNSVARSVINREVIFEKEERA